MMIRMRKRDSFLYLNVGQTDRQTDGRTLLLMYVWTGLLNILVQNNTLIQIMLSMVSGDHSYILFFGIFFL